MAEVKIAVHKCSYDGVRMEGDVPPDGWWNLFITKDGICETCRFKNDAVDHFFPGATSIEIENVIGWVNLDEIREAFGTGSWQRI